MTRTGCGRFIIYSSSKARERGRPDSLGTAQKHMPNCKVLCHIGPVIISTEST